MGFARGGGALREVDVGKGMGGGEGGGEVWGLRGGLHWEGWMWVKGWGVGGCESWLWEEQERGGGGSWVWEEQDRRGGEERGRRRGQSDGWWRRGIYAKEAR